MNKSIEEMLKRRALSFLETAMYNYSNEAYDLAIFNVEQFIQLYLKYLLYSKLGDFPKTHSLITLFRSLNKTINGKLKEFIDRNLEIIYFLEEAYISSRYLPRSYDREIADRVLEFANKIIGVFKWIESTI